MKIQTRGLVLCGLFLVLALTLCAYLSESVKFADAAATEAQSPAACLTCHGQSFDKLVDKKPFFKAPSGEIVNPHQYIQHNERKVENMPNCTDCHSMHPIPLKEKIDLSKVNVDSCFLSCHHQQNFERCSNCHKKK